MSCWGDIMVARLGHWCVICVLLCCGELHAQYDVPYRYVALLDQKIDAYVDTAVYVERHKLHQMNLDHVRFLFFTHPHIIACYNDLIKAKSLQPLVDTWRTYKTSLAITTEQDRKRFVYELCHLIGIVFEHIALRLLSELSDEDAESLRELFSKISQQMPLDELVDILETCYKTLVGIIKDWEPHSSGRILKKRWIIIGITTALLLKKLYERFYVSRHAQQN
jgi:hypothetical protein